MQSTGAKVPWASKYRFKLCEYYVGLRIMKNICPLYVDQGLLDSICFHCK